MKKKRDKKYNPNRFGMKTRICPIKLAFFVEPFEQFIKQCERNDVWALENGTPILELQGEVEIGHVLSGKEKPLEAVPNLEVVAECAYQIAYLDKGGERADYVDSRLDELKRKFLNPLRLNSPLQKDGIEVAKAFVVLLREVLSQAHTSKIEMVYQQMSQLIAYANKHKVTVEARAWLRDIKGVAA